MSALRLILALVFASLLSQFPAFSDQYVQRLGGQVDALSRIAGEFDASANRAGLTRDAAMADLTGSAFRDTHQEDMRSVFTRLDKAQADLDLLRNATALERMTLPQRFRDLETLTATWHDFKPALPITTSGLIAAMIGFATLLIGGFSRFGVWRQIGWAVVALILVQLLGNWAANRAGDQPALWPLLYLPALVGLMACLLILWLAARPRRPRAAKAHAVAA